MTEHGKLAMVGLLDSEDSWVRKLTRGMDYDAAEPVFTWLDEEPDLLPGWHDLVMTYGSSAAYWWKGAEISHEPLVDLPETSWRERLELTTYLTQAARDLFEEQMLRAFE